MQIRIKVQFVLLFVLMAVTGFTVTAHAQASPVDKQPRAEVAITYDFMRSNAPPGGGGNFNLNGGSGSFAWPLGGRRFSLVGDLSGTYGSKIVHGGFDLALISYAGGIRYSPMRTRGFLHPFGQVLAGGAHASGSLVETPASVATNHGAAFAGIAGGGVDLRLNKRVSVRVIEADYLVTTFKNAVNDHQNNLRLGGGLVLHF
jgi:outer membrane immunogenic protein